MVKEEVAVHDISSDSDSDMPELEEQKQNENATNSKMNRSEKKARKAMAKIGMKPVPGIMRVTIKRAKSVLFVVSSPEVVRSANGETYVIFGEAKVEDLGAQAQAAAAQRYTHTPEVAKVGGSSASAPKVTEVEEDESAGPVDETGLETKDIELVMSQVSCSRRKAVNALKAASGDIVEAIMQLTS
jgi:nascent polypeptide-associated complex subunit alpha